MNFSISFGVWAKKAKVCNTYSLGELNLRQEGSLGATDADKTFGITEGAKKEKKSKPNIALSVVLLPELFLKMQFRNSTFSKDKENEKDPRDK